MPDAHLAAADPGHDPTHEDVQQLIEAERGAAPHGVRRAWLASDSVRAAPADSGRIVLTSDASGVKISRDNGTTPPAQVIVDGTSAGGTLTGAYPNPTLVPVAPGGALEGTYPTLTLTPATVDALLPPGTIWAYGGALAPAGWLLCHGQVVGKGAYPKLWAAIGGDYGPSDAVNFTLPDFRGRVVLGASAAHPRGQKDGAETGAAPPHTHGVNIDHNHPTLQTVIPDQAGTLATPSATGTLSVSRDTHTHAGSVPHLGATTKTTDTTAYTGTVPTMPPFGVAQYIIRTGS